MTFGESLRREREMRGVELREIAEATKISLRFLQALETDRPDVLPGGLFPQAFVRQYARYLGLDADKVVADFVYAHRGADRTHPPVAASPAIGAPASFAVPTAAMVGLLVLAVLGLAAWGLKRSGPSAPPPEAPLAAAAPAPAVLPSDRVYPPPATAGADQPVPGTGLVLRLSPRQSCWVKLQVDRVTVLNRTLAEGETQTFEAKRELVLNVGNAGGLAYTLNGRPGASLGKDGEVKTNIVITPDTVAAFLESDGPRPARAATPAPPPATVAAPDAAGEDTRG